MKNYLQESGYKQHGKIFIPPILQLGEFNAVHWLDKILPEIIWIGLLQNKFGLGLGNKLALQITETTNELISENSLKKWLAPLSYYSALTETEKIKLKEKIEKLGFLIHYEKAFSLFAYLYPKFSLSFLLPETNNSEKKLDYSELKTFLSTLYDRTNAATIFMQATAVDIAFQADILTVNPETSLAKFPEIANYPNTEISKEVASSIISTVNVFFGNENIFSCTDEWTKYFWNRGLQIEKCY